MMLQLGFQLFFSIVFYAIFTKVIHMFSFTFGIKITPMFFTLRANMNFDMLMSQCMLFVTKETTFCTIDTIKRHCIVIFVYGRIVFILRVDNRRKFQRTLYVNGNILVATECRLEYIKYHSLTL